MYAITEDGSLRLEGTQNKAWNYMVRRRGIISNVVAGKHCASLRL